MIKGAVLAGGRSSRLGKDKSLMVIDQQILWQKMLGLLDSVCDQVVVSCREHQADQFQGSQLVFDQLPDAGPAGGLISLFQSDMTCAWLIVPCDLPALPKSVLQGLIGVRNAAFDYSVVYNKKKNDIEPLISIWEPRCFEAVQNMFNSGELSIRNYMAALKGQFYREENDDYFLNINTMADLQKLRKQKTT